MSPAHNEVEKAIAIEIVSLDNPREAGKGAQNVFALIQPFTRAWIDEDLA